MSQSDENKEFRFTQNKQKSSQQLFYVNGKNEKCEQDELEIQGMRVEGKRMQAKAEKLWNTNEKSVAMQRQ